MPSGSLQVYLQRFLARLAALTDVARSSPATAASVVRDLADQGSNLRLVAGENDSSLGTQLAMGNLAADRYAERHPKHGFPAGCDNVDAVGSLAPEDSAAMSVGRAQIFDANTCTADSSTGLRRYDAIEAQVREVEPLILPAGYAA